MSSKSKYDRNKLNYSLRNTFTLPSKRMVCYQTRINKKILNDSKDELFKDMANLYNNLTNYLVWDKQYSLEDSNTLKRKYIDKHNIPGRLYNTIRKDLEGKIKSRTELFKLEINVHKERILKLNKDIKKFKTKLTKLNKVKAKDIETTKEISKLRFIIHQKKRKLNYVKFKLERADNRLKEVEKYIKINNNYFSYIGSGDESYGNQNIQLYLKPKEINNYTLKITIPKCLQYKYGKYKEYDIKIHHGYESINYALENKIALTYTFINDRKGVRIIIALKEVTPKKQSFSNNGCIGIDINEGFISMASINRHGNIEKNYEPKDISWLCYGKSSGEINHICYDVANKVVKQALLENKPIVLEKLDFSKKRKELINNSKINKRSKRRLSSFAYNKLISCIMSTAFRKGIEVRQVNPAYTSLIGAVRHSSGYSGYHNKTKLSIHRSAAITIARRALGFNEKLPTVQGKDKFLSFPWKHSHVTLKWYSLSCIIKKYHGKHVWSIWGNLSRKLKVEMENYASVTKPLRSIDYGKSKDTLPGLLCNPGLSMKLII